MLCKSPVASKFSEINNANFIFAKDFFLMGDAFAGFSLF